MADTGKYSLIFHGIGDDSADTLRRVKTALVADLGYSADEVKAFFDKTPLCIKSSPSSRELEAAHSLLEKAGALVMIEAPAGPDAQNSPVAAKEEEEVFIEFDLSQDEEGAVIKPQKKRAPKVYTLEEPEASAGSAKGDGEIDSLLTQISSGSLLAKPPDALDAQPAFSSGSPPAKEAQPRKAPSVKAGSLQKPPKEARPVNQIEIPAAEEAVPQKEIPPAAKPARPVKKVKKAERPRAERVTLFRDIIYAAGLGAAILAIGFWFVENRHSGQPQVNVDKLISQMAAELETKKAAGSAGEPDKETRLSAAAETPSYSVDARFIIKNNLLDSMLITLTAPKPPELTEAQVLKGETPAPWLEKALIDEMKLTYKDGGSYLATGSAKLFVKSAKGSERVVAKAAVSGAYLAGTPSLSAKVLINHGFAKLPEGEAFIFRSRPDGGYQFFASINLDAVKDPSGIAE